MKKYFVYLIIFLIILVGCNRSSETESSGELQQKFELIELTIAHNMDFVTIPNAVIQAAERLNQKYEKEGRHIKIIFNRDYYSLDWGEYSNKLIFSHKSKNAPDIFTINNVPNAVEAGIVLPLDDLEVDIYDSLWNQFVYQGSRYGMPVSMPVRTVYYNKSVLKELGWSSEEVEILPERVRRGEFSFEDFINTAELAVNQGITKYGITHRPKAGSDFFDILNTLGGEYYTEDGQLVFDEKSLLRTFEFFYRNANITKITPQNSSQLGWDTINKTVGSGETFSYFGPVFSATYVAGSVNKTPEQLAQDVSFILFPSSQYNDTPFVIAAPDGIAISSQTKHSDIIKEIFVELATDSSDLLATHGAITFSLGPVEEANLNEQITTHPLLQNISYMGDYAKVVPSIDGYAFYQNEFFKQLELIELGTIKPHDAVADMKSQIKLNLDNVIFK